MTVLRGVLEWFADPVHWQGADGIPTRLFEHLWYSLVATLGAIAIALPIGLVLGHTGRGGQLAINISNLGRAIPSFGIIILAFIVAGIGFLPVLVTLVALALPPIVTNTYVGMRAVDPEIREAAEGMGMTGWQVLRRVEMPMAQPLIMAGIRTSAVQVIATATLAAVISLGGFGRYIIDGLAQRNTPEVVAGAILVSALSLLAEYGLGALQRATVSKGLAGRSGRPAPAAVGAQAGTAPGLREPPAFPA
jgi:osmoprotectant transport system permease protein